jgi:NAD(P)-dependent dehydrogenase (short-subunit alcohol dehydrogenase family)
MELASAGALVTGGASGLGEATTRALATRGVIVTIADRDVGRGKQLAAELDGVRFVECDVTNDDQVAEAVATAADKVELRIAVNCAGVGAAIKTIDREGQPHNRKVFDRVVRVNLFGTFLVMSRAAAAIATTTPDADGLRGVVINTASVAAFDGQIGQISYAASKAGVVGMTLPAARDLASVGVRVCTIAPGLFDTPMMAGLSEKARQSLGASVVGPSRLGRPDEYAALAVAIAENSYLNGEVIRLDGAIRMQPK